jgi:hypothetical protein
MVQTARGVAWFRRRRRPSFESLKASMVRNEGDGRGSERRRRVWFETPEAWHAIAWGVNPR